MFLKKSFVIIFVVLFVSGYLIFSGLNNEPRENYTISEIPSTSELSFFGFALTDAYFDDPHDNEVKINYVDEVADFTNIIHMGLKSLDENITSRLAVLDNNNEKAILHLHDLFFQEISSGNGRGHYTLRDNYIDLWDNFAKINALENHLHEIAAFYLADEPFWNHISYEELDSAATLLKDRIPTVPILIIESYASLNDLKVPSAVDWIGFDQYDTIDPNTEVNYQSNWKKLTGIADRMDLKIVVIMDTQWRPYYQSDGGIRPEDMGTIALNYYKLAINNTRVIGIIGY